MSFLVVVANRWFNHLPGISNSPKRRPMSGVPVALPGPSLKDLQEYEVGREMVLRKES